METNENTELSPLAQERLRRKAERDKQPVQDVNLPLPVGQIEEQPIEEISQTRQYMSIMKQKIITFLSYAFLVIFVLSISPSLYTGYMRGKDPEFMKNPCTLSVPASLFDKDGIKIRLYLLSIQHYQDNQGQRDLVNKNNDKEVEANKEISESIVINDKDGNEIKKDFDRIQGPATIKINSFKNSAHLRLIYDINTFSYDFDGDGIIDLQGDVKDEVQTFVYKTNGQFNPKLVYKGTTHTQTPEELKNVKYDCGFSGGPKQNIQKEGFMPVLGIKGISEKDLNVIKKEKDIKRCTDLGVGYKEFENYNDATLSYDSMKRYNIGDIVCLEPTAKQEIERLFDNTETEADIILICNNVGGTLTKSSSLNFSCSSADGTFTKQLDSGSGSFDSL